MTRSEAAIDPERASADLVVEFASGPAFRFGKFEISGLQKYDASLVQATSARSRPATPYSDVVLNRYVRRLNASGYFASVQAKIDAEAPNPEAATVNIAVIEARPKRFEGGVGYSTDVQFRTNANYRDVNFDGHGLQFVADARLESRIQSGSVKFSASAERLRLDCDVFRGRRAHRHRKPRSRGRRPSGTRWHSIEERDEHALSATYYRDEQQPEGSPTQTANALYAEYEWHWRRVDDLIAPTTG